MHSFRIVRRTGTTTVFATNADEATTMAEQTGGPILGVYASNPTPKRSAAFGAPMGRASDRLDPDGRLTASRVPLDQGGYDRGGAYWGHRPRGQHLYAVQDGVGNLAFVDAPSSIAAKEDAIA